MHFSQRQKQCPSHNNFGVESLAGALHEGRQSSVFAGRSSTRASRPHCYAREGAPAWIQRCDKGKEMIRHKYSAHSLLAVRTPEQELWSFISRASLVATSNDRLDAEAMREAVKCVQQLPHVRCGNYYLRESAFTFSSAIGRVRAWIRLAIMQKKLADYFEMLINARSQLKWAFLTLWICISFPESTTSLGRCCATRTLLQCLRARWSAQELSTAICAWRKRTSRKW